VEALFRLTDKGSHQKQGSTGKEGGSIGDLEKNKGKRGGTTQYGIWEKKLHGTTIPSSRWGEKRVRRLWKLLGGPSRQNKSCG